ncbi:MAG TPA: adenylate/guanylate cyclase domain-containing protein [Gaiellaceae bacterium]|nr:adenylate/guanylate cyclase domain-containing protein [Gaiellaceae bacterium]
MAVCPRCGQENPEGFRLCGMCGAALVAETAPAREQRKTVTVLFCDVTGSTELGEQLDPEALRVILARYFERMKEIVERHGGTVEKFIGDAVMAVFGVPVVHEDDALRALRSAVEMREAFPELGVQGRIGVTTGEVVTGTEERLATGDAVNVAARLEQAAQPGEILVGQPTLALVREAVEAEELPPLDLKGKSDAVPAFRLLAVVGELARRGDVPMVGREREQRMLADAWERSVSEGSCQLFTILGAAGVGKSRLAAEFLASLEDTLVVRGRCLPYGEGITYWPVVEVIKQLPQAETDPVAARTVNALVADEPLATSPEEIAWAFRKQLEAVAAERPLVCVFDDLHWGEETFLDLVEHVADLSRGVPILLLCMARPELLDRRPGWAGGKLNAANVLLEPLGPDETARLIESLAHFDEGLKERIAEASEGNPLFLEEMVALAQESGDGEVTVPPTIHALLAARLDQLEASERGVLERGAVEGRVFHRGAVQALAPEDPQVTARLTGLVRKELVRPDKAQLPGEDAYRFRHLLIRDAAYDALPKATRAELHERFADWLEEHGTTLVELDEILGFHLEQAYLYGAELGAADDGLARRASQRLAVGGRRAHLRSDLTATIKLLQRARAVLPSDEQDVQLDSDLADALFFSGQPGPAEELLREAEDRATARGDGLGALQARLHRAIVALYTDPATSSRETAELGKQAIPVFEAAGDERGLAIAWWAISLQEHSLVRFGPRNAALERSIDHARRAGDERMATRLSWTLGAGYLFGPATVQEGLRWHASREDAALNRPYDLATLAILEAMRGQFDEARGSLAEARSRAEELGQSMLIAHLGETAWEIELHAGTPMAAEQALRESCARYEQMGERGWLSTRAGELGHMLCELGRYDEAEEWARKSRELGADDDIMTQMLWRQVLARIKAQRGEVERAERLAREAVAYGESTDGLIGRALAHLDLAEVLERAGRHEEAADEIRKALALCEQKGDVAMAAQARERLGSLEAPRR